MQKNRINKKTIVATLLIIIGATSLGYAVTKTLVIPNIGHVYTTGIEAYWNGNKTNPVTQIDWGSLYPGNSTTQAFYLYNPGNTGVALSKTMNAWLPVEAENHISFAWNPDPTTLASGECLEVNLTLTIAASIATTSIQDYGFNIVISATEA